jgi:nucleotide-binding universal stress UspA family protein
MAYKSILVHVDTDKRCATRLDFAAQVALAWGAHLVGLHVIAPVRIPSYVRAEIGNDFIELQHKHQRAAVDKLASTFTDTMRRHGLVGSEWRAMEGDAQEVVTLNARYADLLIVGQRDPDEEQSSVSGDFPEVVALAVGRPVLVLPYAGSFNPVPKHAMVCWKPSRESTRAVTDALPMLQRAEKVSVLSINPEPSPLGHGEVPGADLALYLARHKVKAEVVASSGVKIEPGDFILSRAADLNVDMLVMGAYGHARMRELVFGGVTRTIMQHMTVPALVSH